MTPSAASVKQTAGLHKLFPGLYPPTAAILQSFTPSPLHRKLTEENAAKGQPRFFTDRVAKAGIFDLSHSLSQIRYPGQAWRY